MRNLVIVFISLFSFCSGILGQQKCQLNVGSFNLRYDNDGDKDDSWTHRKDMAVSLVHFHDFDVMGHLDYVVRYGKNKEKEYSYKMFADEIDALLRELIEHGKGLELNMAGFKYGLPFAHPHPDILKRYRELGGEIVTVGADGHRPEHIAWEFDKACDILKGCNFKYYTEFKERKPIFLTLR